MGIWLCGAEIRSGTVPGAEHDLLSLRAKSNFSFGLIFIFYMQPSGSGVNQVDVQAAVLDLGINVSSPSFILPSVSSRLSKLRRLNSSRSKMS